MNNKNNVFKREKECKTERDIIGAFLNDFRSGYGLTKSHVQVLHGAWVYSDYFTNEIFLVKSIREKIANDTGLSDGGVKNAVTDLIGKGFLKRLAQSHYAINSEILPTRESISLNNNFRVEINYTIA